MKILKAVMLTLLISLCVTVAAVAGMHIFGDDSNGASPRERVRNTADSDAAEIDDPVIEEDAIRSEPRFWQRVSTISQETGFWQYYPIIPWDVLPGETVVLSVSAEGFKGWEADPDFAHVELFDEKADDEYVYVSFIMPEEEVSIAALYSDEIPSVNFDNQREMIMAFNDMREYGAAPVPASSDWIAQDGLPLPNAYVGRDYSVRAPDPIGVIEGYSVIWVLEFPEHLAYDPDHPEGWLRFTPMPDHPDGLGGGTFWGTPKVASGGPITFWLAIEQYGPGQDESDATEIFRNSVRITIFDSDPPAAIRTPSLPDAVVGVKYDLPGREDYGIPIETEFFPAGSIWRWDFNAIQGSNPLAGSGLSLWVDENNRSNVAIRGTPTAAAVAHGPYNFFLRAVPNDPNFPDLRVTDSPTYNITVWNRPELSLIQKAGETPILPPAPTPPTPRPPFLGPLELLDGMVGTLYGHGAAIEASKVPGKGAWEYTIDSGLINSNLTLSPTNGLITGANPALPPNADDTVPYYIYTFDVVYTTEDTDLIIGYSETVRFTVRIWQRPEITTDSRLPDGMEDVAPANAAFEPPEADDWYNEPIDIIGLPTGTKWTWRQLPGDTVAPFNERPPDLRFNPSPGDIEPVLDNGLTYRFHFFLRGIPAPTARGEYKFIIELECIDDNPNIKGTKITQDFEVKIWPRTYLHITGDGIRGFYVRRDCDPRGEPNWGHLSNPGTAPRPLRLWENKRAVMPGTRAIISRNSGGVFQRWEVSRSFDDEGDYLPARTFTAGSMQFATTTVPGAAHNGIGGPDHTSPFGVRTGYGIEAAAHAYVVINMPRTPTTGGAGFEYDGDVFIRAAQPGANSPRITGHQGHSTSRFPLNDLLPRPVPVGGLFRTSLEFLDDVGDGPVQVRWEIIPGRGILPPDLRITEDAGAITVISGDATQADSYDFSVAITLRGTMRIERDYNIVIVPWNGLGDVNGDGVVNLSDLVLLVRWQRDKSININIRNASLSTNGESDCECCTGDHVPGLPDIDLLARYFTHNRSSLGQPQN